MSVEKEIEHENHRFSYMTTTQLRRRLSRITKADKLIRFATAADANGHYELAIAARKKLEETFGVKVQPKPKETKQKTRLIRV